LNRFSLISENARIDPTGDPPEFPTPGSCVRRLTLDALLVEAADNAGADVRTGCRVTGILDETGV
jgi:flavin-dependent dehydrogenase